MAELEIINGPVTVWWGPVGETFTAIGAAVAGNWVQIGTSAAHNYSEDGVSIRTEKSINLWRALGSGYPRKAFLTEADLFVTVSLADFTLAQLRTALNQNVVTSDGGGFDWMEFDVGLDPTEIALLIRAAGKSPLIASGNLQFNLNRVVEVGSQNYNFSKGDPVMGELEFQVIYDEGVSYPVGRIVAADA